MVLRSHMERNTRQNSRSNSRALIFLVFAIVIISFLSVYRNESGFSFFHVISLSSAVILLTATYIIASRVNNDSKKSTAGNYKQGLNNKSKEIQDVQNNQVLPDPEEHGFDLPLI